MLIRCQHDSSTDPLRLMTAALRFTTVELRMLTNAHAASTIRYGASTIQAGSATVASRPPTNLHDLVVVMRQSRGGGGGGYSHFFFIRRLGPSIYRSHTPPAKIKIPKKKQKFQEPHKIFEILAPPPQKKIPPFCTLTLKMTQKCIEMTPKYSVFCDDPPKIATKSPYPKNIHLFF